MKASSLPLPGVTDTEHEQGFKDMVFPDRTYRLYAPYCEAAAAVAREIFEKSGPIDLLVIECLKNPADPESAKAAHRLCRELRHSLSRPEFAHLVDVCLELAFGQSFMQDLRKILAGMEAGERAA